MSGTLRAKFSMVYCCVPFCKSNSKKNVPRVSFHEIPADLTLRQEWLQVISQKDSNLHTTLGYSVVCTNPFLPTDFKETTKTRRLKKDTVPSLFDDYPSYMKPVPSKQRGEGQSRKRRRESALLSSPCRPVPVLYSDDFSNGGSAGMGRGNVASAASVDPNLGPTVEGYGSNRSVQAMRSDGTQTDPERSSALYCDRRKWRKWERELQSKAERLQSTVDSYKEKLRKLKEDCYGNDFLNKLMQCS